MTGDEARAQVTQALHQAIEAGDGFDPNEFITTWVAVVHLSSIDDPGRSAYYLMSPTEIGMPPHVVRGLLHEGLIHPAIHSGSED